MHHASHRREAADVHGRRLLVTGGTKGMSAAMVERPRRGGGTVSTPARSLLPGSPPERCIPADVVDHDIEPPQRSITTGSPEPLSAVTPQDGVV